MHKQGNALSTHWQILHKDESSEDEEQSNKSNRSFRGSSNNSSDMESLDVDIEINKLKLIK